MTGDWYTLSMDVQVPEDAKGLDSYNIFDWNGNPNKYGWRGDTRIVIHNGRNHITFKWGETGNKLSNYGLLLYRGFGYAERPQEFPKYPITTSNITLVKGTIGLESYVPAPEDVAESVTALENKLLDPEQGEIHKLTSQLESHKTATDKNFEELSNHPLTVDKDGYWRIWDIKQHQYVTTEYQSRGEKGETGAKGDKGDKPVLTLDSQYRLVADGKLVSAVSLKGRDGEDGAKGADGKDGEKGADGHTPEIHVGTDYYIYVDGVKQRYIRGQKGEPGHNPSPEEVLSTSRFAELLGGEVTSKVTPLSKEIDKSSKYAVDLINETQTQLCDLQVLGMSDGGVIEVKRQAACCHYDYLTPSIGSETNPPQPPKPKYIKQQIPLTLRSSHDALSRQVSNLQTQLTSCTQRLTATKQELAKLKADTTITPILNNTERRKYSSTRKTYGDTLYPQYGDWLLSSDTESLQLSFAGLRAEVGRSIYIQTRKQVYLNANGHTFFGLPGTSSSVAVNQMLDNNTTYRFLRADATTWLVTSSASPYPWT